MSQFLPVNSDCTTKTNIETMSNDEKDSPLGQLELSLPADSVTFVVPTYSQMQVLLQREEKFSVIPQRGRIGPAAMREVQQRYKTSVAACRRKHGSEVYPLERKTYHDIRRPMPPWVIRPWVDEMVKTLEGARIRGDAADDKATETNDTANEANDEANEANGEANEANDEANEANDEANEANDKANEANEKADAASESNNLPIN